MTLNESFNTIETASRSLVNSDNNLTLREMYSQINAKPKQITQLKNNLNKINVLSLYVIFYSNYYIEWFV
jgi:hypothetical protein